MQSSNKYGNRGLGDTELTFLDNTYDPDPADTSIEGSIVYLIRKCGRLRIETDRHLLGLFDFPAWRRLLAAAGFELVETQLDEEDKLPIPMFICRKPA